NLDRIYRVTSSRGVRMGLIVWATLIAPEVLDDPEVHRRLNTIYSNFPLSTKELYAWYVRYTDAQREFASRHADVVLVDLRAALAGRGLEERLRLFLDMAHYTTEGNSAFACAVSENLDRQGVLKRE